METYEHHCPHCLCDKELFTLEKEYKYSSHIFRIYTCKESCCVKITIESVPEVPQ